MSVDDSSRSAFLQRIYDKSWDNIARTEDLLWKVFVSYSTVVLGAALLADKLSANLFLGVSTSLLLTAVATCHSVNVHAWVMRNLLLISNVEATLLRPADYGRLLPATWKPPYAKGFASTQLSFLIGFIYPIFGGLVVFSYWSRLSATERCWLGILSTSLILAVLGYVVDLFRSYGRLKRGAPGPVIEG